MTTFWISDDAPIHAYTMPPATTYHRLGSLGMRSPTFLTIASNGIILCVGLVNSILLSRWLEPVGRGEIAAALLWPVLLSYLGNFGMTEAIIYFSATEGNDLPNLLSSSMAIAFAQTAVVVPLSYALMPILLKHQHAETIELSRLGLSIIPLSLATQYILGMLQGRMAIVSVNFLRLVVPIGYLLGTVMLIGVSRLGVSEVVVVQIILNAVTLVFALGLVKRSGVGWSYSVDLTLARNLCSYGARVYLGGIASMANARVDQTIMAAWVAPAQLGLYVVAVSASNVLQVIPLAVRIVGTPSIARQHNRATQLQELQTRFSQFWILSIVVLVPLAVGLPWLIPTVFGSQFSGAVIPAEILLIGGAITGANSVLTGGAQAFGMPILGSKAELTGLFATAVLLAVLLPTLGITGAAIASTIAYGTTLTVLSRGLHRNTGLSLKELFFPDAVTIKALAIRLASVVAR